MQEEPRRTRHLAQLLTRSIFLIIATLVVIIVIQNYQVNREVVAQEIVRSKKQTQSLVQEIMGNRLKTLEIQHDSHGRNAFLIQGVVQDDHKVLNGFFNGIDQLTPDFSPDFRFISRNGAIRWDDENAGFYGISKAQMQQMAQDIATGSDWYLSQVDSSLGQRYLLIRRAPVIDPQSGEVVAMLFVGVVLNNNFALVNSVLQGSNADEVLLVVDQQVIAASSKHPNIHNIEWLDSYSSSLNASRYMVSRTDLLIDGMPTFLSVYTVQDNSNVVGFVRTHYLWVVVTIFVLVTIALITRVWIAKRISSELNKLLEYTGSSIERRDLQRFDGANIEEFDRLGLSFHNAFLRLQEQEQQFSDLFNYSLTPITLWSAQGELQRFNPASERCFEDEQVRQHLIDQLQGQITMSAQGATLTGINTNINHSTFRWNISPILRDGQVVQVMAQGQDITSFIEAEKQSQAAREQAEESARVQADFLAKMSHELRTPLNGILGVSQLLKSRMHDQQDREHMEVLCHSGEHLLAVLNDILDFSKIEQGKFHIENSTFKLIELTTTVDKIFQPLCADKQVQLNVTHSNLSDVYVHSDQVRLNQIIFNLVSNAVKFTHHGQIDVVLSATTKEQQCDFTIEVKDTGIGIEQARLNDIFDPFVQAESTTTREYGGSGLGLAIVHSLVSIFDGEISVSSQVNQGTRFVVKIPLQVAKQTPLSESANGLLVDPKTLFDRCLHVLLVEDNHTNAFIAKAFCEKYGMKVTWVQDGLNAIESLQKGADVDLILMDNQLPSLGGIEATEIIRNELKLDVPVYACTADGMEETKQEFLRAGANYVIVKPIKELALNKALIHFKQRYYSEA
ncbi:quorum-sensing autoinducer 2 sensor kinase/phosphatase LuxQ [Vibrio sinaloensis]|uniref:quorum-sensing autoinducer 2 sensor kinase/phosphatase LuxQ n=1 Tax=Photobacterium sp. (strain ATCC 43367) TaxID=379097 RepID=UPI002061F8D1|nr:quorum-sensing autoinducer 2 sensor kinase/phosphatase LuxQ [Vibrio sinaloensis]UPQ89848.1 ATP-binding protein [Vibrio sinaloensis]